MTNLDFLIQRHFPTIMVPKSRELVPCEMGRARLLMARSGLFIETRQPWAEARFHLWKSPRLLPYGEISEIDDFSKVFSDIVPIVDKNAVPAAASYAENSLEWSGFVIWNKEMGYGPVATEFLSTTSSLRYYMNKLPENTYVVADIHSHGKGSPFFSPTDNKDDAGGVKICIVLGNYKKNESYLFDGVVRYAIEGFFVHQFPTRF